MTPVTTAFPRPLPRPGFRGRAAGQPDQAQQIQLDSATNAPPVQAKTGRDTPPGAGKRHVDKSPPDAHNTGRGGGQSRAPGN